MGTVIYGHSPDLEALKQKARRGELFLKVAIGYVKMRRNRIDKDPDQQGQSALAGGIGTVVGRVRLFSAACQALCSASSPRSRASARSISCCARR